MRRIALLAALGFLALGLAVAPLKLASHTNSTPSFVHFESAHVRPEVLTPDRSRLLVVNTPDGYLRVFDVTGAHPVKVEDIPVGLEPVSVNCLNDSVAWVVNFLSDDVSIVNLNTGQVRATLRVGDEPGDVVFVQLPELGASLEAGGSLGEVESTKSVSDIYAPIPGTVVEVNAELGDAPQRLNEDPYGEGWICVIEPADGTSLDALLDAEGYRQLTAA